MTGASPLSIDEQFLHAAADRVAMRCDMMANLTEHPDNLTRTFCSAAMKNAHQQVRRWMREAHLDCELDALGNLIGRRTGSVENSNDKRSERSVFMIGSHLDTVVNAGRFDGALGILLGLGAIEVLNQARVELEFDIHVVAFSEEEGVRFQLPFIGSLGIAGKFDRTDFQRLDANGISLKDALKQFGSEPETIDAACYGDKNLIGFMEAHIEQAESLQESDEPVGVVSTIAGQSRATIVLEGQAGHAGTVLHDRRRDALAAAAELILRIEKLGQETAGLFATVGNLVVTPGLSNVISSKAELRLDLRHELDDDRIAAFETIKSLVNEIAIARQVAGAITAVQHTPATPMDHGLSAQLESAIIDIGLTPKIMVSGAGHDAMIVAQVVPSCMLFVRCRDGISHHPDEFVSPQDIAAALNVMVNALIRISNARLQTKT